MYSAPTSSLATFQGSSNDVAFADALKKVSPQVQQKAQKSAKDFEAVFLNSMFSQMTSGLKGEGPFGDTPGTGVWRSMLTEQYSKNFAKAGGVGISSEVFRTLILQQAKTQQTKSEQTKAEQAKTYRTKSDQTKTSSETRTPI